MLLKDGDHVKSDWHAVEGTRSLQAIADFEAGFKGAGTAPKETVADLEVQGNKDVPETRDLGFVEKGGQSDELCELMQSLQKENATFHAACAPEKAFRAKNLLEVNTLWGEKTAQKNRIEKFKRSFAEELLAQEGASQRRYTQWTSRPSRRSWQSRSSSSQLA